jgi:branched-chain amino acid transport system substrate-binding protein
MQRRQFKMSEGGRFFYGKWMTFLEIHKERRENIMTRTFTKTMGIASMVLFLIVFLSAGNPAGAVAKDTVKIAQISAFSGPFGAYGQIYHAMIKFAVDQQNAKGGLLGKKIEIIKADSELKPDVATRKAKKLILEDKVNFIGGTPGSHIAIALNKVATEHKTIFVNYAGMSDIIQGKEFSRYAFRVCQNAYNFTSALAQLMATEPYRKFYIICQDYTWGHDVAKAFKEQIKIHIPDAEIVGEDYHPLATKDFAPYIKKVINAKADAIFTGNWGPDASLLVKQARAMGLKTPFPFVMTFGWDAPLLYELKDEAVGIYSAYDYTMRVDTPENKAMIARYHEQHKKDEDFRTWWPDGHVIIGWNMVFAAVERAGSLDPEKVIEALEGMWYKTPVGWWAMRKCDHQLILPMFGGRIEPGWNPYYNGSIRPDVKFPIVGPDIVRIPAMEVSIPPTSDYNPRCQ